MKGNQAKIAVNYIPWDKQLSKYNKRYANNNKKHYVLQSQDVQNKNTNEKNLECYRNRLLEASCRNYKIHTQDEHKEL